MASAGRSRIPLMCPTSLHPTCNRQYSCMHNTGVSPTETPRPSILQGTLDLMVLKTLAAIGPQHGYGLARRIEQMRGCPADQSGHHLSLPDSAGPETLDLGEVGSVREQPTGDVLPHHKGRTTTAAGRNEQLGATLRGNQPSAATLARRLKPCCGRCSWSFN
jgi:hypothetical protein